MNVDQIRARRLQDENEQLRSVVQAVTALCAQWEADDNEHLNTFGQHLPCSIAIPAEQLRAVLASPGPTPEPTTCAHGQSKRHGYFGPATGAWVWCDGPGPTADERPKRFDQCDDTCTVDCGHCKGSGR